MENSDLLNLIIQYEGDGMSQEDALKLFQHLVDTGLAWQLQGHYGRTARMLIEQKLINPAS